MPGSGAGAAAAASTRPSASIRRRRSPRPPVCPPRFTDVSRTCHRDSCDGNARRYCAYTRRSAFSRLTTPENRLALRPLAAKLRDLARRVEMLRVPVAVRLVHAPTGQHRRPEKLTVDGREPTAGPVVAVGDGDGRGQPEE